MDDQSLFDPGFYDLSFDGIAERLWSLFVEPFDRSRRREYLVRRFVAYLNDLRNTGMSFEIWVDDSFTTTRVSPNDVDVVVFYNPNEYNLLSPEGRQRLDRLTDAATVRSGYDCDVYFVRNHRADLRSYWRGWFGFSRNEEPKGIPRIFIR